MVAPRALLLLLPLVVACQTAVITAPPRSVAPIACVTGAPIEVAAAPAALPPEALSTDDADDDFVRPCTGGSPEHQAARSAVEALGARVRDLPDGGDPSALKAELATLLETECFRMSTGDPHDGLELSSAVSLKAWWYDGGESWVEHYLSLAERREVVIPPSPRRALTSGASTAKHPLAPLLCPPGEALATGATGCGHEARGWALRADRALGRRAEAAHASSGGKTEESCAKEAAAAESKDRFDTFRACLDDVATRRTALPLGRFKAPKDGWFVITGLRSRRGCDEIRAYDLATGAAWTASQCTNSSRAIAAGVTTTAGKVPVASLREAAWMVMLAGLAEDRVRTGPASFAVPKDIAIERPGLTLRGIGISTRCGWGGSLRSWSWMRDQRGTLVGQVSGTLRWPSGCGDAEEHAAELIQVAEDALESGCAPTSPPATVAWSSPGPATTERGTPAVLDDPGTSPLRTALSRAGASRPRGPCPK